MTPANEYIGKLHDIIVKIEDYAIIALDEKGIVQDWNAGAEKLKGYKAEEIIGRSFKLFYTEVDLKNELPEKLMLRAMSEGKAIDEGWRVRKDGSHFWGSILITAIYDEGKQARGFLKISRDLSERKKLEDKLKQANEELEQKVTERTEKLLASEKHFRGMLDNMLEGIQIHDFDWKYIYVNEALVKYSTYTREELMGYTLMEKYPGIERSELFATLEKCMNERLSMQFDSDFTYPDGSKAFFELSIQPVPEGLFILSVDKTEQKNAKDKLLKVNRLYQFISNINKSIVHIVDQQELLDNACRVATEIGEFKMAWFGLINRNDVLERVSFCGDTEVSKMVLREYLDYNDPALQNIPTVKVVKTGKHAFNNDMQADPALADWRDDFIAHGIHSCISMPIFKFGKVVGIFGMYASYKDFFDAQEIDLLEEAVNDISFALENFEKARMHKETEALVENNERRFRALIEKSTDMKSLTSEKGIFMYASPSFTKVFGYSQGEILNNSPGKFIHPDHIADFMKNRNEILKTPGSSFDFQYRLLHKDGSWIWCEGTITNMLHEPAINAIVSNFKDISEKKVIEEELEFNRNNLNALINNNYDLMWSVDTDYKLITFNRPFAERMKQLTGKESAKGDHVFAVPQTDEMLNTFKSYYKRAFSGEIFTEIMYAKTHAEFWSEISFYPIRSGNEITGTACHSRNITESKRAEAEREKMIADIIKQNKNLSQFTYIISHNLRGPIANILGITNLLRGQLTKEERTKSQTFLYRAVENLDHIVLDLNKMLEIRNEVSENKVRVHFSELVSNIKSSIQNMIQKQNVRILADFSAIDSTSTLKSYIYSIFYNLISNSIKYKRPDKESVIEIWSELKDEHIVLKFRDNGLGIDLKQHGEKLFGLYKRFHLEVEGKGLGLFMVKTQVEVLGGNISVSSEPNIGTEFTIELPKQ